MPVTGATSPRSGRGTTAASARASRSSAPADLELDLHRTFAMGPFGLTVDLDDLWADGQEFQLAGTTLTALAADERLLHACYHASLGDYPPRLLPHRDVAEMLLYGERDEDRLLKLARSWGGEAVVARAVSTAWELFDIADVTALSAWASRYRSNARDRSRLAVYTDGDTSYAAKSLASLTALPRMRDRVALLRMMAAPDPSFLSGRQRSRAAWLHAGVPASSTSHGDRPVTAGPQDPRRVLWLAKGLGRGGAERLIVDAAALLDRDRYDVEVAYLLPWKDALVPDLTDAGVPVHCLGQTSAYDLRWVPPAATAGGGAPLRPGPHPGAGPGGRRADGPARAPAPSGAHRAQRLGPVPLADVLDQRPDVLPERPRHRGVGGGGEQRPGPPGATPPRPYAGRGRPPRHPAGAAAQRRPMRAASRPARPSTSRWTYRSSARWRT